MEAYELYDEKVPERLNDYIMYLYTVKGKSKNTIDGYKIDLRLMFRFLKKDRLSLQQNIEDIDISDIDDNFISDIKLTDLYRFMEYLKNERGNGNYARARKTQSIKAFFSYLQTKLKAISVNPAVELESPSIEKRNPVYLTLDESVQMIEGIKGENYLRNKAITILFLNCGLRLSELVGINIQDIREDTLTVIGKGNKQRTVYLNNICLEAINDYIDERKNTGTYGMEPLFLSEQKKRLNKRSVQLVIKKILTDSGLTGQKYSPHKLRHTAATIMYKYGNVDIRTLQQILGHEHVSTTQIYTHIDDEELRGAMKKNPLAFLDLN